MYTRRRGRVWSSLAASLIAAASLPAQASTSESYVLSGPEICAGGPAAALAFKTIASVALDAPACAATSTNFVIQGGFSAHTQSTLGGRPWYIATCPMFTPLRGGTTIEIFGDELHLGSTTSVSIGGNNAPVSSRQPDKVVVTTPANTEPGYKPATLTNGSGTSSQSKAVGYLPMLDLDKPPCPTEPFEIIYRGTQGDLTIWIFSLDRLPVPFPLPPYFYGNLLHPATLTVLFAAGVPTPDGTLRLPVPVLGSSAPKIWLQTLTLATTPGYTPGSFTNLISVF